MHFLPKNLSGFLYHFALKFRGQIIAAQLCAFAWTINSTLWPYLIKNLIDAMKNYRPALDSFTSIFVPIFSSMVGLWIIASCMFRARGLLFAWIVPRLKSRCVWAFLIIYCSIPTVSFRNRWRVIWPIKLRILRSARQEFFI